MTKTKTTKDQKYNTALYRLPLRHRLKTATPELLATLIGSCIPAGPRRNLVARLVFWDCLGDRPARPPSELPELFQTALDERGAEWVDVSAELRMIGYPKELAENKSRNTAELYREKLERDKVKHAEASAARRAAGLVKESSGRGVRAYTCGRSDRPAFGRSSITGETITKARAKPKKAKKGGVE